MKVAASGGYDGLGSHIGKYIRVEYFLKALEIMVMKRNDQANRLEDVRKGSCKSMGRMVSQKSRNAREGTSIHPVGVPGFFVMLQTRALQGVQDDGGMSINELHCLGAL